MMTRLLCALLTCLLAGPYMHAADASKVRIGDIATVEGVRDNPLIGYGLVVGLNGTGDRRQTVFTTQTLSNILLRMGLQVPPGAMRVNNVAAVFVTASLPPFARPGTQLDVTVSSIGDAKSLDGGTLLISPLRAADGQVYATAQGSLTVGGYASGAPGNSKQLNHPTVGRIPAGAIVERDSSVQLSSLEHISLLLREPDFAAADTVADAINREMHAPFAQAIDGRRIELLFGKEHSAALPSVLARIQAVTVEAQLPAKVIVNERTGTIVLGKNVRLGAVSILHGNLSVEIATELSVSQPNPLANGQTTVVPEQKLRTQEGPARRIELVEGATVEQLVNGLQSIGATSRDVVSILQALKAAGALHGELEVL